MTNALRRSILLQGAIVKQEHETLAIATNTREYQRNEHTHRDGEVLSHCRVENVQRARGAVHPALTYLSIYLYLSI
jgi:hypothetical protein